MSEQKNSQIQVASKVEGMVTEEHFKLVECEAPKPKEGEIVVRSLHVSVDPYLRGRLLSTEAGEVLNSGSVVQVVESEHKDWEVGDVLFEYLPWRLINVINADKPSPTRRKLTSALPHSTALGVAGMPGLTAYAGLIKVAELKESDKTVVVSGAAGAVGSVVGQLAKIKGKRVVGTAGGKAKCDLLKAELGFDAVIDYKEHKTKESMMAALKEACPDGVDVYFDNVGGLVTECVIELANKWSRVAVCGQISLYNSIDAKESSALLSKTIYKNMTVRGFMVYDACAHYPGTMEEYFAGLPDWLKSGQIKFKETFVEGFENIPKAFVGLFTGTNTGKMVVNVAKVN